MRLSMWLVMLASTWIDVSFSQTASRSGGLYPSPATKLISNSARFSALRVKRSYA